MANIKNFGIKGVAADIQFGKGGGFMVYDKSNNKFQVKDSGSSLEDIEFATVLAGTWAGTEISVAKGGTGLTSIASGKVLYTTGADTFGSTDISATGISLLGSADATAGRTALGLGNVATQANTAIDIDGGAIDGTVIGANATAAASFTTINASSTITGNVTGALTGNADTATTLASARAIGGVNFNGSADITLPGVNATGNQNTTGSAASLTTGQTISSTGDIAFTTGAFDGSGAVTGTATLATVNSDVGSVGSTTTIPVLTINAKGLVTAATTATIATSFNIAADSGTTNALDGGETLTFEGTTNEVTTEVSANKIKIGLVANPTIGGDLTVSGNLTVSGTRTDVNVTNMAVEDSLVSYATGNSSDAVDIGFFGKYNDGSDDLATGLFRDANDGKFHLFHESQETISGNVVDKTATGYAVASMVANTEGTHTGAVTGNVTGDLTGDVTGDLTGDVTGSIAGATATMTGAVTGGTLTDGAFSVTSGAITGATTIAATDLTLAGNLVVNGTTTTVSSTNTTISDKLLELGTGSTGSASGDAGIIIERGNDDNAFFGWDESADQFQFATTTATGSSSGDLTLTDANLKAGTVTFASLSDGTVTLTAFTTEGTGIGATDNDTTVPTSAAVKDYVDTAVQAVDDTVLRATIGTGSSSAALGTMPSTAGRTYIGSKVTIKVSTPYSGDDVDGIVVNDGTNDLMVAAQNDPTVTGVYIVDLGAEAIASGASVTVGFVKADGSTASTPTAGALTATMEYQFVS